MLQLATSFDANHTMRDAALSLAVLAALAVHACSAGRVDVVREYASGAASEQSVYDFPSERPARELRVLVRNQTADCTRRAVVGSAVVVAYTARLGGLIIDGATEDAPLELVLGDGAAIDGFEMALLGLCPGHAAQFTVPSELAFGERGRGSIPGGASLAFEVSLLRLRPPPEEEALADAESLDLFRHLDADADGVLDRAEVSRHFASLGKAVPAAVWAEDADGDGVISHREYSGPKGRPPHVAASAGPGETGAS